jgi:uncharacterized protein
MSGQAEASPNLDSTAPHVAGASVLSEGIVDWGPVPAMIEGQSHTSGVLLHKDGGGSEAGIWICTPGLWRCHVERDELCHFVEGRCTYTHESGEEIEISPDTAAFFPEGWKGTCRVHETVRKVYMIR